MIQISMVDANDFVETVTLEGEPYKLHFSWNDFAQQWTVDVRNMQNVDIVRGIAVVPNYPLFLQHHRAGLPRGELMAIVVDSSKADNQTIGRKSFVNGLYSLVYVPEVEVNAIRNAS